MTVDVDLHHLDKVVLVRSLPGNDTSTHSFIILRIAYGLDPGDSRKSEAHVIPAFSDLAFIRVKGKKS